jgi:flavin reductase (DIM6/NTAB) family NADH-FMN oxidoreductase RutF
MALDDELLNRVTWKIPNALALVGSAADGERNAMTTSWITQLSMEPVLIGVGVDNTAVTHRLISAGGSFTVNLWNADDTRVFVKFSKPASAEGDTLNGRAVFTATTGAPVFTEAIA